MKSRLTTVALASLLMLSAAGCSDAIRYKFTPEDPDDRCGTLTRTEIPPVAANRHIPLGRYCRQEG